MAGKNNMSDISSVEALAAHHEELRRQQFFRRQHSRTHIQDHCRARVLNPGTVYCYCGIAHAGNQVDEEAITMRFVQPDWIFYLAAETLSCETSHGSGHVVGGEKEIQVFGRAPDSGMNLKRESPRDNIRNTTAIQSRERLPEHRFLLWGELRPP